MYQDDYVMRQIQMMVHAIARVVLGKGTIPYAEVFEWEAAAAPDRPAAELKRLIDEKRIGAAEDLLFEYLAAEIPNGLALAVGFYERLNALPDEALRQGGFSRAEIAAGLRDAALKCGLNPAALSGDGD